MSGIVRVYPAIALRGLTILPEMITHFDISREKSKKAVEQAMLEDQLLFLVTQRDAEIEEPTGKDLYEVGMVASVKQVIKLPHGLIRVMVQGLERAKMLVLSDEKDYLEAEVEEIEDESLPLADDALEAMRRYLEEQFNAFCEETGKKGAEIKNQVGFSRNLSYYMNQIMIYAPFFYDAKQQYLEINDITDRYAYVSTLLGNEVNILKIKAELKQKAQQMIDKNQKEYVLREQMHAIRKELGDDEQSEADTFAEKVEKLKAPAEVKTKLKKEIKRLRNLGSNNAESSVIHNYIETMLEIPWEKVSKDRNDLAEAKKILDEDHYGLDDVKERVLEFLAVRSLNKSGDAPILCLVGPPGTGKTSIAKSIARALNKKYVRVCLGGVRDEAEIRGHRKTYIGAMPGRIAESLRQAGTRNPLMLLDEIDKVSSDYKGDTSSALLEVLDSEQNSHFRDHFLEVPLDLSKVMFIATANDSSTIPRPLLDRMEVIQVSSYTENEKLHIAKEHLMGKQLEKNGIDPKQLSISQAAMEEMIHSYTREAGVRQMERVIGKICRKAAREILEGKKKTVKVTGSNLEHFLGKPIYRFDGANETDEAGIVRGLAWTAVGGDTLSVEVNILPGKGELMLTGQLGDVMKESAAAGISFIRSKSKDFAIPDEFFKEHDIHIHIPEGAVPKDGPSAGITMATAMISAIKDIPVYANVAMTGEITLRGRVLPIGGLKEKLLAANKAGMKRVVVPEQNRRDVEEISEEIKKGMEIIYAVTMDDVLPIALHYLPGTDAKEEAPVKKRRTRTAK